MFYSQVILARKGPLGNIWLAAHWDQKLTKNQIFSTDISESVENILNPQSPLALRVSGHLMLGVVRIYARKVKYLMTDCTNAMWKIKMAFKPGTVDLPETAIIATANAIDDPRFFGHVVPDYDFPELADTAFAQNMLTQYEELRTARVRTLAPTRETTQRPERINQFEQKNGRGTRSSIVGASPNYRDDSKYDELELDARIDIPVGEEYLSAGKNRPSELPSSIHSSRASDIGLMRGEGSRSSMLSLSMSNRRSTLSSGMGYDGGNMMNLDNADLDMIPPFDSQDLFGAGDPLPLDDLQPFTAYDDMLVSRPARQTGSSMGLPLPLEPTSLLLSDSLQGPPVTGDKGAAEEGDAVEGGPGIGAAKKIDRENRRKGRRALLEDSEEQPVDMDAGDVLVGGNYDVIEGEERVARGRPGKRKRKVVVEDRIEISSKEMKQILEDRSPILRRVPDDVIPLKQDRYQRVMRSEASKPDSDHLLRIPSQRGLCPELREVFAMTMAKPRLNFPRLDPLSHHEKHAQLPVDQSHASPLAEDVEVVRAGDLEAGRRSSVRPVGVEEDLPKEGSGGYMQTPDKAQLDDLDFGALDNNVPMDEYPLDEIDQVAAAGAARDPQAPDELETNQLLDFNDEAVPSSHRKSKLEDDLLVNYEDGGAGPLSPFKGLEDGVVDESAHNPDRWNERTRKVAGILQDELRKKPSVSFQDLTEGSSRRTAAGCFLEVLQLATWGRVHVQQHGPFEDISIAATPLLAREVLA